MAGPIGTSKSSGRRARSGDLVVLGLRFYLFLGWLFVDRSLIKRPFAVQFRIRFERMGPTYIKLGQILSLREDLLPKSLTDELKNLLSELPAVPFLRFRVLVEDDLGRPIEAMFAWVAPTPLGSASLAQSHRARLHSGDDVVLKVLKPGVRETIKTDTQLLRLLGRFLQILPGALSAKATDRRVLPLYAAGGRSAQRSGQCRDFRCQLQRTARYPFPQDLPCVQQP